jgi:hypothetical protein
MVASRGDMMSGQANIAEIEAENARWDSLLATDEAQDLLEKLAGKALDEYRSGQTKGMGFIKIGSCDEYERGS